MSVDSSERDISFNVPEKNSGTWEVKTCKEYAKYAHFPKLFIMEKMQIMQTAKFSRIWNVQKNANYAFCTSPPLFGPLEKLRIMKLRLQSLSSWTNKQKPKGHLIIINCFIIIGDENFRSTGKQRRVCGTRINGQGISVF